MKRFGHVLEDLVIDLSQSLCRMSEPKINGTITTPTTGSKLWYRGKMLGPRTMFNILGWPDAASMQWPDHLPKAKLQNICGNMIAVPTIGKVMVAVLASVHWDRDTHLSWMREELQFA